MDVETYEPNAKQQAFHGAAQKYRLLLGAAGSGKTLALCQEDFVLGQEFPGSVGVVFRRAYPQLRDSTQRTYMDMLPPELLAMCKVIRSEGREEVEYPNGSRTLFRCLDDYKKQGSMSYDRISVDEATEIDEREILVLIARLRGKIGPRRLMLATNPPDEDHFLHRFFVEDVDANPELAKDRIVIHSSTYDNKANLPEDYIRELEGYPPAWKEKFLYGHWGFLSEGKPVFQEFNALIHVAALKPVKGLPIVRGWDFGFHHPACVWVQRTPTGHVHWLHELMGTGEELSSFAARVQDETARHFSGFDLEDYCDVAGTQKNDRGPTAVQVLHNQFNIWPNYRKLGRFKCVERISYLLRTSVHGIPLLQIDPQCRFARKALAGGYYMNEKTNEPEQRCLYANIFDAAKYATVPITEDVGGQATPYDGRKLPTTWRHAI